jgi:hypothetical protein
MKYRAEAGISADTWFPDYRRSYAINARRRRIDAETIMRQTGHKTRAAFDRYNIVDDSDQRAAVAKYEAAVLGHGGPTARDHAGTSERPPTRWPWSQERHLQTLIPVAAAI